MSRIKVTDETGEIVGWFDIDKAAEYIDRYAHQSLYRTAQGRWVLYEWSEWQGHSDQYWFIAPDAARAWLIAQGHDDDAEKHFGEMEEERGPGRPEVGVAVHVRLGDDRLARVDQWAAEHDVSRAEALRRLVDTGLVSTD